MIAEFQKFKFINDSQILIKTIDYLNLLKNKLIEIESNKLIFYVNEILKSNKKPLNVAPIIQNYRKSMMIDYLKNNYKKIFIALLISIIFSFIIFPHLISHPPFKNYRFDFLNTNSLKLIIGTFAVTILINILIYNKLLTTLEKFRNNFTLKSKPFIFIDYFIWITIFLIWIPIFSFLIVFIFQNKFDFPKYPDFPIWYKLNLAIYLIFFSVAFFHKHIERFTALIIHKYVHRFRAFIISIFKRKNCNIATLRSTEEQFLYNDNAIRYENDDLLGRLPFVESLSLEIQNISFEESFVYGLYGTWGEGKTSVVNLLINKIEKTDRLIIVKFDPWNYKDELAIIEGLFREIEKALSKKFILPCLQRGLRKYSKIITNGLISFKTGINLKITDNESYERIKEEIERDILDIEKKLLIIVDDIDRLQINEIFLIFKLIRNNTNFKNTIFLLSLDPIAIKDRLEKNEEDYSYFEKIINKTLYLPSIESFRIKKYLLDKIFLFLKNENIEISKIKENLDPFSLAYDLDLKKVISTLRDTKRYLNSFLSTYKPIIKEINILDALYLEIIKVFYPSIFEDIWKNKWIYILNIWSEKKVEYHLLGNAIQRYIPEHYSNVTNNLCHDTDVLKKILDFLFMNIKDTHRFPELSVSRPSYNIEEVARKNKFISHPDCFDKYFIMKIPYGEIPDAEIEVIIDQWPNIIESKKESFIDDNLLKIKNAHFLIKFFEKIETFLSNENDLNKLFLTDLIKAIFKNVNLFSKDEEVLKFSDYKNVYNQEISKYQIAKIFSVKFMNNLKDYKLVRQLISEITDINFLFDIIQEIQKYENHNIMINYFLDIFYQRLHKYCFVENKDIFELNKWQNILNRWFHTDSKYLIGKETELNKYFFNIIGNDLNKLFKLIKLPTHGRISKIDKTVISFLDNNRLVELSKNFLTQEKTIELLSNGDKSILEELSK